MRRHEVSQTSIRQKTISDAFALVFTRRATRPKAHGKGGLPPSAALCGGAAAKPKLGILLRK
jgi:hypothetical protein